MQTARAAAVAGTGHAMSTLLIAVIVWFGGLALAVRSGQLLGIVSSLALVAFGAWVALASLREIREHDRDRVHPRHGHTHLHRHENGVEHRHWHVHGEDDWHEVDGNLARVPTHEHVHETSSRTTLLLILGSSPMIEGIPAFFAASRFGISQLAIMAVVFAACTIGTYVVLSVASARGMQRLELGPFERYGEVISGGFIALLGVAFLLFPRL
jgi:threonine/homoserine/homoserine lactone efflux protein